MRLLRPHDGFSSVIIEAERSLHNGDGGRIRHALSDLAYDAASTRDHVVFKIPKFHYKD